MKKLNPIDDLNIMLVFGYKYVDEIEETKIDTY